MRKFILLVITAFFSMIFYANEVQATSFTNQDAVVNITLENGPSFNPSSRIKLKYEFDLSGIDVKPNDMLELEFPNTLELSGDPVFNFLDDNGDLIAIGAKQNGKIVITFTDIVSTKEQIHGFLDIELTISNDKLPLGKNILEFETKTGPTPIEIEIIPRIDDMSKKGVITKLPDNREAIRWTIVVNRNNLWMNEMTLTDTISDNSLSYIPGSLKVSQGLWINEQRSSYRRVRTLTDGADYFAIETANGISVKFPAGSDMYIVDLFTIVNDPDSLNRIGTQFRNTANLSWLDENNNSIEESAGARVTIKDTNTGIGGSDKETPNSETNESTTDSTTEPKIPESSEPIVESTSESSESSETESTTDSTDESYNSSTTERSSESNTRSTVESTFATQTNSTIDSTKSTLTTNTDKQTGTKPDKNLPKTGEKIGAHISLLIGVLLIINVILFDLFRKI